MKCVRRRTLTRAIRAAAAAVVVTTMISTARPALAADSNSLAGIHWWGYYDYNVIDAAPAQMLDSTQLVNGQPYGGWDMEIINTHGPAWQNAPFFQPLYSDLYTNKKITPITRIEYEYGKTVPSPSTINSQTWATNHVVPLINTLKDSARWWQLGNEPNIIGEGTDWANGQVTPAGYAQVYKDVRNSIQSSAQVGAPGAHKLMIAPVSPGGVIPGTRWISGNDWLGQTIDAIKATNTPIDGVALHAYDGGGGVQQFMADITQQLEVIDAKGLSNVPVFLTEWNRFSGANPPDATAEANAANFVRGALKAIDRWNRTPGNHNIVGSTWFVYDSGDRNNTATAPWAGYSIKYWKTAGNPYGSAGDLQTAFEQAVDQRYAAGFQGGTRPIPSSIQTIDNFETGGGGAGDEGHFDKRLDFASAGSRYGFDTAASDATRDGGANYSKTWGQKIQVLWNGDSRGWQVRHVSGDSTPATNTQIPIPSGASKAALGFFLRTAAQGVSTQIVVDGNGANGGANSDAGRLLNIVGDDEWHFYEWDLLNPADWTTFTLAAGSDGVIPGAGGFVTIDSILFYGAPTTGNATLWFDFVGVNNA
ncbi:MAG: hypothetical protein QOE14_2307, partial [Humisphaera sp.]|nr:hypothetical protein [Humisphaera sp.]